MHGFARAGTGMALSPRCYNAVMSPSPPSPLSESKIPVLLDLCLDAGEVICEHYHRPGETAFEAKSDSSPVTEADLASHHILAEGLSALPEVLPLLSEECSAEELVARRDWRRFWMVDPLDGTKEFIGGTGEFKSISR